MRKRPDRSVTRDPETPHRIKPDLGVPHLLEDLRDTIPRFDDRARILSQVTTRDDWPPQRAVAGFDMTHETPFTGLWNVGDAVKEYANGGTTACAETAEIVVGKIAARFQPGRH